MHTHTHKKCCPWCCRTESRAEHTNTLTILASRASRVWVGNAIFHVDTRALVLRVPNLVPDAHDNRTTNMYYTLLYMYAYRRSNKHCLHPRLAHLIIINPVTCAFSLSFCLLLSLRKRSRSRAKQKEIRATHYTTPDKRQLSDRLRSSAPPNTLMAIHAINRNLSGILTRILKV